MTTPIAETTPEPNGHATESSAVSVIELTKRYGDFVAVDKASFEVPKGSVFGLIGPNGAGKSTTFSVLASLLKPTSGTVRVCGHDPQANPADVRQRLGYMPDQLGVYGRLSARDYLEFFVSAYRLQRRDWDKVIDGLLHLVGMEGKADVDVDTMSRGMQQRMSLARALVNDPEVLVLDEPASGLDPRARVEQRELISQLAAMGKTIIVSSHILVELQQLCTDIAIIEGGKIVAAGTPDEIARTAGARTVTVGFADGSNEAFEVPDATQQAALLRRLIVDENRPVISCTETGGGLEDLFMHLTEGGIK